MLLPKPLYAYPIIKILNEGRSATDMDGNESAERPVFKDVKALIVDDEPMNLVVATSLFNDYEMIIDTAGRLHNKQNLMNELNKMTRIVERELPESDVEILMVLDATTGQNGLNQAKQFLDFAGITGIVLTKLDGTAKGGVVFGIANELNIPVKLVGVGEQIDDLIPFDAQSYVQALFKE